VGPSVPRCEQLRKISPLPGFDLRTVLPVASHYTDYRHAKRKFYCTGIRLGVCSTCDSTLLQGGSNMTGTNYDLFTHKQSRSYLNHLVPGYRDLKFKSGLLYRLVAGHLPGNLLASW
jgi:hypothetical protein